MKGHDECPFCGNHSVILASSHRHIYKDDGRTLISPRWCKDCRNGWDAVYQLSHIAQKGEDIDARDQEG